MEIRITDTKEVMSFGITIKWGYNEISVVHHFHPLPAKSRTRHQFLR